MREGNDPAARRRGGPPGGNYARHRQRGGIQPKALVWLLLVGFCGFALSFSFSPTPSNASPGNVSPAEQFTKGLDDCKNETDGPAHVVQSCTSAIDSGKLSDNDRIGALNNRGIAYQNEGDFAHAIQDFSRVLSADPDHQEAINNRGALYMIQGDYDNSIVDYTKALHLNPDDPITIRNRCAAYFSKGDYTNAMQDCTHALMLEPRNPAALQMRGVLFYFKGDYKNALEDEKNAVNADGSDQYSVIWLYLARVHYARNSAKDSLDELSSNSANLQMDWPWPVIQVYLGKAKAEDLLAPGSPAPGSPAVGSVDPQSGNDRVCEANFYLGERALIAANSAEAQRDFQAALSACADKSNLEYRGSEVELARMAKK